MMAGSLDAAAMIAEMELMKQVVLHTARILAPYNRQDYYYKELLRLADDDYFFETYQVIAWAALRLRPQRIMEIGSRNGGSLVQLLSMYHRYDGMQVVCFDLWREIGSPRSVRRNLQRLSIPTDMVEFIRGDSRQTVPAFKQKRPDAHFDYVLVDGGHEREVARTDLKNVADLIDPGGILIFDDIGPESYQLVDVWREFQAAHREQFDWYEKLWRKGVAWAIRR
jgi:predicted O-methyltransferase YrrM